MLGAARRRGVRTGERRVAPAGGSAFRRRRRRAGALEGSGPDASGARAGVWRGEGSSGAHRRVGLAGARGDPRRGPSGDRGEVQSRAARRDHFQPLLPDGGALRRIRGARRRSRHGSLAYRAWTMKLQLRHFFVALLPLLFGLGASWGFAFSQNTCGRLVGPIFAPKCHWIQLEYQLGFQMAGTLLGCLIAAVLGASLERRSRRRAERAQLNQGVST